MCGEGHIHFVWYCRIKIASRECKLEKCHNLDVILNMDCQLFWCACGRTLSDCPAVYFLAFLCLVAHLGRLIPCVA